MTTLNLIQVQVRKYQAGYKHLADTYLKSRNELNKLQKKSKNITATKEFKVREVNISLVHFILAYMNKDCLTD